MGPTEVQRLVVARALTKELSDLEHLAKLLPVETQAVANVDGLGKPEEYSGRTAPLA